MRREWTSNSNSSCRVKLPPPPEIKIITNNDVINQPPPMQFPPWNPWMWSPWTMPWTNQQMQCFTRPPVPAPMPATTVQQKPTISADNTTFIGDAVFVRMAETSASWLVQVVASLTCKSIIDLILQEKIKVDRKYIFIACGSSQLYTIGDADIRIYCNRLLDTIMSLNSTAKIFMVPILPRPADNDDARAYIVDFNKKLTKEIRKLERGFSNITFIPVQNHFLRNRIPEEKFYSEDRFSLNIEGCKKFKSLALEAAGFKRN